MVLFEVQKKKDNKNLKDAKKKKGKQNVLSKCAVFYFKRLRIIKKQ